jgi:uncharacterized membrane protein
MTASMKKNIYELIKQEAMLLAVLFAAIFIILKIAFYKEEFATVLTLSGAIFWLFMLPGYCIMLIWKEQLDALSRTIMSLPISAATIGIVGYYLSLIGIHAKYHHILLPLTMIILPIGYIIWKESRTKK